MSNPHMQAAATPEAATERSSNEPKVPEAHELNAHRETSGELEKLPPVLTVIELAAVLRVNPKTLRNAIRAGKVPGVRRIGRTTRVLRDQVIRWLETDQGHSSRSRRNR